jgi:hypothetical protein
MVTNAFSISPLFDPSLQASHPFSSSSAFNLSQGSEISSSDRGDSSTANAGLSTLSIVGLVIGCLVVIGLVIVAVFLLWRRGLRRDVSDGHDSPIFRELYAPVDSTFENPLMTEHEVKFDGIFGPNFDESQI